MALVAQLMHDSYDMLRKLAKVDRRVANVRQGEQATSWTRGGSIHPRLRTQGLCLLDQTWELMGLSF